MNPAIHAVLMQNLKILKLSAMPGNSEGYIRCAKQDSQSYEEFLLNLTTSEVEVRSENGLPT